MKNLKQLSYAELIDLLAKQTEQHTRMLAQHGLTEELEVLRKSIQSIQEEIKLRDQTGKGVE
jgi:hypothetical protein